MLSKIGILNLQGCKLTLSMMSIYRIAKEINFTRKRVREKYYPEKKEATLEEDLKEFYKELHKLDYKKTICLDETGIKLSMTLSYGRNKSGKRVIKKTNKYPFKKYNLLAAICYDKVVGWILYPETNSGIKSNDIIEFYKTYIKDNEEYKGYNILMDNAVIHKSKALKKEIEDGGHNLFYSFSYHPDTNGIENFFSQLKHYIKKESPQTYNEISPIIKKIIRIK